MVKTRAIQVRTTRDQYERIKENARADGFNSVSAYLRHVALHQDFSLARKIAEIHDYILRQSEHKTT